MAARPGVQVDHRKSMAPAGEVEPTHGLSQRAAQPVGGGAASDVGQSRQEHGRGLDSGSSKRLRPLCAGGRRAAKRRRGRFRDAVGGAK